MNRFKGTVKNNVVMLEEGAYLPDGTEVEVRVRAYCRKREEAFQRIRRNPITRFIGFDEVMEEDKPSVPDRRWPRQVSCRVTTLGGRDAVASIPVAGRNSPRIKGSSGKR